MIANYLTLLRILLIPLIIALISIDLTIWAFVVFVVTALTDGIDGYLARRLNQVTDLGKFLDPLADKLLVIGILLVLVLEPRSGVAMPTIIIIGRELFITGWRSLKVKRGKVIPASYTAKIKTVLQLVAIGMLILDIPFALLVLWLAVIVSIWSGVEYVRNT